MFFDILTDSNPVGTCVKRQSEINSPYLQPHLLFFNSPQPTTAALSSYILTSVARLRVLCSVDNRECVSVTACAHAQSQFLHTTPVNRANLHNMSCLMATSEHRGRTITTRLVRARLYCSRRDGATAHTGDCRKNTAKPRRRSLWCDGYLKRAAMAAVWCLKRG
jgi:hypothetical protein